MDESLVQSVYETLRESTAQISKTVAEHREIQKQIDSNCYSHKYLVSEIIPKRDALKRQAENDAARAIKEAREIINQYRQGVADQNNLNPADLTPDIELLRSGIPLKKNDVMAMLKRNKGNSTMEQVILRSAAERGIEIGAIYTGGQQELRDADSLEGVLSYYERRILEPNALQLLDKFFLR